MTVVLLNNAKRGRKKSSSAKGRKNVRTIKPTKPSRGVALNYFNVVNRINTAMIEATKRITEMEQRGASAVEISAAIESLQSNFTSRYDALARDIADDFVTSASRDSKNKTEGALARTLNVPLEDVVILDAPGINDIMEAAIAENVQLIKTIPSRYFGKIAQAVSANFSGREQTGQAESLAGRIQKLGFSSKKHAQFIARDQTAKVTSAVTRARHEAVGIKGYLWRNSNDERVVGNPSGLYPKGNRGHGNHWVREGKFFLYSKPPHDGNPGDAFNCRCTAEAVIDTDDLDVVFGNRGL